MILMKITLRDLFWLVLLVAIGIAWGQEYLRVTAAYKDAVRLFDGGGNLCDVVGEATKKTLQARIQTLSKEELVAESVSKERIEDKEPYWIEMSRRRMVEELRAIYSESENLPSLDPNDPPETKAKDSSWDNGRLLTALRRAEGKPDPIRIEIVSLGKSLQGRRVGQPVIIPKITNVDIDRERCHLTQNGDDRGARHERWRVHLTNSSGELMEDARDPWGNMGGLARWGMLEFGEVVDWRYEINAQKYVKAPPSGNYTLELLHAEEFLADDREMTGRIVWKSAPVPVIVEDLSLPSKWHSLRLPLVIVAVVLLIVCVAAIRGWLQRRDVIALTLIALLAASWVGHSFWLKQRFEQEGRKPEATWTMRRAE